jgi:methylmalonyl-CoA mutase
MLELHTVSDMEKESPGRESLFEGFPPVPTSEWEEKIRAGLKEGEYENRFVWQTPDGFQIKPYYRSEDLEDLDFLDVLPGQFPFLRGTKTGYNDWLIRQDLCVTDFETTNRDALHLIERGIDSIGFDLTGLEKISEADLKVLIRGIPLEDIPVNFKLRENFGGILRYFINHLTETGQDPAHIRGSLTLDPLGRLASTGNFTRDMFTDFTEVQECLELAEEHLPGFRPLHVGGDLFHDAGATVSQALAFTLGMGNEYLAQLSEMGTKPARIVPRMQFEFSVGSSYFLEIAKLRAARLLWSRIVEAWSEETAREHAMFILTGTSAWNQTLYDPHVNMLRGTTEAMSAVIGGTDSLIVRPFDAPFNTGDPFSTRIARNTQVVLKEESHLDKVIDPGSGSYYIEKLTATLIETAWELFLKLEENGGFHKSLIDGFIQQAVGEAAETRSKNLATRRNILVGTNQYPNFQEERSAAAEGMPHRETKLPEDHRVVEPLDPFRGSRDFELMRLRTEHHAGKKPLVFMLTLGNLAMRRARAMFASNFFACAGFRIIDNIGFESPEEGAKEALDAGADIVVLCSSDEEYASFASRVRPLLKDRCIQVIAGHPQEELETLKQAGFDHFIHRRSNVLDELKRFQQLLGIKS